MITAFLIATSALSAPEEEVAFFSDDVTKQSEQEMCDPLCSDEEQFLVEQLNPTSRRLYNSLDGRGKLRAIELAKTHEDKNKAVQIAANEMAKRQNDEYPFQKDYQEQLEERSRLKPYTRRYGY